MSKILVDHLYHHHLELLQQESQGQFDFIPVDFRTQDSRIENHLPEALAIIGRVDPFEAQYQSAKELALIQTLSAGFEEVDLERAQRYSVQVANNNGANAVSVAEHVLLQILSLFRQLLFHHRSVSQGPWENRKMKNREISGKTLGLIGLGQIGKMVAKYAVSLGMNVQYFDVVRQQNTEQELGLDYVFPETLLRTSDVVSYHVPITSYTRGIINRNSLSMMKPDAVLINSARENCRMKRTFIRPWFRESFQEQHWMFSNRNPSPKIPLFGNWKMSSSLPIVLLPVKAIRGPSSMPSPTSSVCRTMSRCWDWHWIMKQEQEPFRINILKWI